MRRAGSTGFTASSAVSWDQFKRPDLGDAWVDGPSFYDDSTSSAPLAGTPVYPWGFDGVPLSGANFSNLAYTNAQMLGGAYTANVIVAVPQVLPPGTLRRLVIGQQDGVGSGAGAEVRLGIWANRGSGDALHIYPGTRLYDSGAVQMNALGARNTTAISVPVSSGGLFWASFSGNALAVALRMSVMTTNQHYPVAGMSVKWGNGEPSYNRSLVIAWKHALAYGALPSSFPSATPIRLTVLDSPWTWFLPLFHYGFEAS